MLLRTDPKPNFPRPGGCGERLSFPSPESGEPSKPAALNALAVRGPSHSGRLDMLLPGRDELGETVSSTLILRLRDLRSWIFHAVEVSEDRSRTVLELLPLACRSRDGLCRLVSSEPRETEAEAEDGL